MKKEAVLILHNIRSTYNVGAIFRTADAAGISKIYLTGYTPAPVDEFGRTDTGIAKTAIGAEKSVLWGKIQNTSSLVAKLKKADYFIVAVEQDKNAIDYKKVKLKFPCAIVLGDEVKGISLALLKKCDIVAEIPMKGKKESLNVSVSAGVALYRLLNL